MPRRGKNGQFLPSGKGKSKKKSPAKKRKRKAPATAMTVQLGGPAKKSKRRARRKSPVDPMRSKAIREQLFYGGAAAASGLALGDYVSKSKMLEVSPTADPESLMEKVKKVGREQPHRFIGGIGAVLFFASKKLIKKRKTRLLARAVGAGLALSGLGVEIQQQVAKRGAAALPPPPDAGTTGKLPPGTSKRRALSAPVALAPPPKKQLGGPRASANKGAYLEPVASGAF